LAEEWVTIVVSLAIGLGGGLLSGLITIIVGRISIRRKIDKELRSIRLFGKTEKCTHCNREIQKEAAFCTFCGVPAAGSKYCQKCNITLPDNALYCYRCSSNAVYIDAAKDKLTFKEREKPDDSTDDKNDDL